MRATVTLIGMALARQEEILETLRELYPSASSYILTEAAKLRTYEEAGERAPRPFVKVAA